MKFGKRLLFVSVLSRTLRTEVYMVNNIKMFKNTLNRVCRNSFLFLKNDKRKELQLGQVAKIQQGKGFVYTYMQKASYCIVSQQNADRRKIKLGVIGCGRIAYTHMKNILNTREIELSWIVDTNQNQMIKLKDHFYLKDTPIHDVSQLNNLLEDASLDGVYILSSTIFHSEQCCQALQKGKAVFVEKPIGENISDITRCYETAEKYNQTLLTGFNRRFDPTFMEFYNCYQRGAMGDPVFIKLTSRDCPRPSAEFFISCDPNICNLISDMAIHDIDTLVWLTKAEKPESVFVQTHIHDPEMKKGGWEDTAMMMIKYKSGIIASIDVCRDSVYGYDIRVEVDSLHPGVKKCLGEVTFPIGHGTQQMLRLSNLGCLMTVDILELLPNDIQWLIQNGCNHLNHAFGNKGQLTAGPSRTNSLQQDQHNGSTISNIQYSFHDRFEKAYLLELEHFIKCLKGTESPLIKKEECILTWKIIEKALESWRTKNVVYF